MSVVPSSLTDIVIRSAPKLDVLIKCITLLYREKELENSNVDNSKDIVRTIINLYRDNTKQLMGGETTMLDELKNLTIDMINNIDGYDKHTLLNSLELILKDKESVFKMLEKTLNAELSVNGIKKSVLTIRSYLNTYYKEQQITALLNKASYSVNRGFDDMSITDYAAKVVTNLEALTASVNVKDPGIVDEFDISNENDVGDIVGRAKKNKEEGGLLITGWNEINDMTQKGLRKGETVIINALQHKYKSGFTQSLFMQLPMHNKPILKDPTKKPLMLYISCEDDAEIMTEFMYRYLYNNENDRVPDLKDVTTTEIAKYIKERLTRNGYNIKILRVNPSEWTYRNIFNTILKLEAEGYEVHACFIDYLAKIPTTGCISSGPSGTDVRDMFNRCRNFFSSL